MSCILQSRLSGQRFEPQYERALIHIAVLRPDNRRIDKRLKIN